jgi:hypothetical protein
LFGAAEAGNRRGNLMEQLIYRHPPTGNGRLRFVNLSMPVNLWILWVRSRINFNNLFT